MKKIILASASPRRRELLEQIGIEFDVVVSSESEENIDKALPPDVYTTELALLKAAAAAKTLASLKKYGKIIISADTVVYCDGKILGKPKDADDARNILMKLSGSTHEVYTGFCVMRTEDGYAVSKSVKTTVKFKNLTDTMIDGYIRTQEPFDKAGAYGIQGMGSVLIDEIIGDYFNVVGLPLSALYEVLKSEFDIDIFE